jgi:hypothetical protein
MQYFVKQVAISVYWKAVVFFLEKPVIDLFYQPSLLIGFHVINDQIS